MAVKRNPYRLGGKAALESERKLGRRSVSSLVVTADGCSRVLPRPGKVRCLEPANVVQLMLSMEKGDKLPPIGITETGQLVYGAHRLTAARLLANGPGQRAKVLSEYALLTELSPEQKRLLKQPSQRRTVELRADTVDDPEAELRENAHRRQLSPELVREQLDVLVSFGYRAGGAGRPKPGQKPHALARLAEIWNVTPRALQLQLAKLKEQTEVDIPPKPRRQTTAEERTRLKLQGALTTLLKPRAAKMRGVNSRVTELARELLKELEREAERPL